MRNKLINGSRTLAYSILGFLFTALIISVITIFVGLAIAFVDWDIDNFTIIFTPDKWRDGTFDLLRLFSLICFLFVWIGTWSERNPIWKW